jgi:hypothetical protein
MGEKDVKDRQAGDRAGGKARGNYVTVVMKIKAEFVREVKKRGGPAFARDLTAAATAYEQARVAFCATKEHSPEFVETLAIADEALRTLRAAACNHAMARYVEEHVVKKAAA